MSAYDQLDEEIQRILDEGSASARPAVAAEFRDQMAADLAARGTTPEAEAGLMPKGTKVIFAEPELDVAGPPMRQPLRPKPAVPVMPAEKVVDGGPRDDIEEAYARARDRDNQARQLFERGARELVAGLTRTEAQPIATPGSNYLQQLMGKRKASEETRFKNEQQRLGAAKYDFEQREAARRAAEAGVRRKEDLEERDKDNERAERGIAASMENAKATRELAGANFALRRDEAATKKQERDDKMAAGTIPFVGGQLTMRPGLSDSDRSKARDYVSSWNTALGAVDGVAGSLDGYLKAPSIEKKGEVEAQLVGALTALNVAYKQGAMADTEARRLSSAMGVDLTSGTGIAAAVASWFGGGDAGKAGTILQSKVRTLRDASRRSALNSLSAYGEFAEGGGDGGAPRPAAPKGPVKMKFPDGSVHEVTPDKYELALRKGAVPNG